MSIKGISSAALGSTAAITGGAIDGAAIGANDPSTGVFTALETESTLSFGAVEYYILGTAEIDMTSTTAVQIGTTPDNGKRFIPLFVVALCTAANSPTGLTSTTLGIGQTGANYTDWMFQALDGTFNVTNEFYQWALPRTATAILSAPPDTAIFAKLGTAISGGSMTTKVSVIGICI